MVAVANEADDALVELAFDQPTMATWDTRTSGAVVNETERQVRAYFAKQLRVFDVPLAFGGTEFMRTVWGALLEVPYGTTTSYGSLGHALGVVSARAIGMANGKNPLAIIVPCHRVIGANGSLTGYGGGLPRKHALLVHEGAILV
ncbi:MAG TPA: methylated-DNA--[protein]-cysteine S-methyltransferase [Myxococcota bacterium]